MSQDPFGFGRTLSEKLSRELAVVRRERGEAVALLKTLEWGGWLRVSLPYDPPAHGRACLVCGGLQSRGHKPHCRLDAFLARKDGAA